MDKKEQAIQIIEELCRLYPDADCTLDSREPWQLLVSGILAAQCTDARVNIVAPMLFDRYPDVASLADAPSGEVEEIIRSCGFFRVKARSIIDSMQLLRDRFDGQVPVSMEDLLVLPGIGRKIASLILGDCFGIPAIVVDTHCGRISGRLGLTDSKDPHRIERDLAEVLPREHWIGFGHRMVAHGRAICRARDPRCGECTLAGLCRKGSEILGNRLL